MVKKISCRVLNSGPFGKSGDRLPYVSRPNNNHQEDGGVSAAKTKDASNTVTYTNYSSTARISIDNSPTGQIVDCYV